MIYFVRAEQIGYIKIGLHESDDPKGRVRELQVGSPVKLTLLGTIPGDRGTESDLHRRFAHAHHQGECRTRLASVKLLDWEGDKMLDNGYGCVSKLVPGYSRIGNWLVDGFWEKSVAHYFTLEQLFIGA